MHAVLQLSCVTSGPLLIAKKQVSNWRKWNVVLFFFPQRFFFFSSSQVILYNHADLSAMFAFMAFKHSLRLAAVCWVSVCQWPPSLSQVACEWQKARIARIFRTVVFVWSQEHVLALTFLKTDDNGTAVTKKSLRKADWRVIGFFFLQISLLFFGETRRKKGCFFKIYLQSHPLECLYAFITV